MVAFSGTLDHEDKQVTEQDFNFLPDGRMVRSADIAKIFNGPHFNFMIAADKFQVGFDQPKLTTMFVDKFLRGVDAVQTLSRLNRIIPGINKSTHVLDFRNTEEDIYGAFAPYYEETDTEEGYDHTYVYVKRTELEVFGVIAEADVRKFGLYFKATDPDVLKKICGLLEPARQRFLMLLQEDANRFRKLARALERPYGCVTITSNFMDPYFNDLVNFIHYLLKILPKKPADPLPDIEDMVAVDHFRLVFTRRSSIELSKGDPLSNPRDQLSLNGPRPDLLSEIVKRINDRWGLPDFNDADKIALLKGARADIKKKIEENSSMQEYADWTQEAFDKQFGNIAATAVLNRVIGNSEFTQAVLNDPNIVNELAKSLLADLLMHPDDDKEK